ncbi:rhodanese-like domain-containing protein [Spirochaetota bacterium]
MKRKKTIILSIIILILTCIFIMNVYAGHPRFCSCPLCTQDRKGGEEWIKINDLYKGMMDGDIVLVDVRSPSQYAYNHIYGAFNFIGDQFENDDKGAVNFLNANKEKLIVFYCQSELCFGSKNAWKDLKEKGHKNIAVFKPGFKGWERAGGPLNKAKSNKKELLSLKAVFQKSINSLKTEDKKVWTQYSAEDDRFYKALEEFPKINQETANRSFVSIVYFYMEECSACKKFEKTVMATDDFTDAMIGYNLFRINIETEKGLKFAKEFGIKAAPSMVIFTYIPAKVLARTEGVVALDEVVKAMNKNRFNWRQAEYKKRIKSKRKPINKKDTYYIDISSKANKTFYDKIDSDKKGGWTDQGPENDARMIPKGEMVLSGVPYKVLDDTDGDNSCIILWGEKRPYYPKEVSEIKVDKKAKSLAFLHCTGWTGGHDGKNVGMYRINYIDGTSKNIDLIVGKTINDAWHPSDIEEAKATIPFYNPVCTKLGLYSYIWRNPEPEKKIKSIDVVSSGAGPMIICAGITGITK